MLLSSADSNELSSCFSLKVLKNICSQNSGVLFFHLGIGNWLLAYDTRV